MQTDEEIYLEQLRSIQNQAFELVRACMKLDGLNSFDHELVDAAQAVDRLSWERMFEKLGIDDEEVVA